MYTLHLGQLSAAEFMAEYWQKKPVLLKGGFANFIDPLTTVS